jgi:hypothetical protein
MKAKPFKIQSHVLNALKIEAIQNDFWVQDKINELIVDYQKGNRKPLEDSRSSQPVTSSYKIDQDRYKMFKAAVVHNNESVMKVIEGLIVSYLKERGKL